MLLKAHDGVLCIVDVQERLLPAVRKPDELLRAIRALLKAARVLRVPVIVTEHCADSIGHTVDQILTEAPDARIIAKEHFCATEENGIVDALHETGRRQVIVAGTEAHVCVLQTGLGISATGFDTFLVADATASRDDQDRRYAIERARDNGVTIVTTEMVMFEWCANGRTEEFRNILPDIRDLKSPTSDTKP